MQPSSLLPLFVRGGKVEQMSGDPADIVARLAARRAQHLSIEGGLTIENFLRADLLERLILTWLWALLGQGLPLFGVLPRTCNSGMYLREHYASALVKTEYQVLG